MPNGIDLVAPALAGALSAWPRIELAGRVEGAIDGFGAGTRDAAPAKRAPVRTSERRQ